jgi:hypothetical protein
MEKPTFTPEEISTITGCALAVFNECAYDLLTAVAEEKGKSINAVTVSRAEAMEIALDAGRIEDRLKKYPDLLARWSTLDYEAAKKLVRPGFKHARYGM